MKMHFEEAGGRAEVSEKAFDTEGKQELIRKRAREMVDAVRRQKPDTLFFLDRSARPVSWIFREAWKKYNPDEEMPNIKFIDVGPLKTRVRKDGSGKYFRDLDVYGGKSELIKEEINPLIEQLEADEVFLKMLNDVYRGNKRAMVIDDYKGLGTTRDLAIGVLQHFFPDIDFSYHSFTDELDDSTFKHPTKPYWQGPWQKWNTEKEHSLMKGDPEEGERPFRIVAEPERDPELRAKGLALKKEIKELFK